jgi:hypothetical protein
MVELILRLGQLGLGFAALLGPLLVLMLLLKHRDRRQAMLSNVVYRELNVPHLRGLYSVKIETHLLGGQDTVTVDILGCLNKQLWDVIMDLSPKLPAQVWLAVTGLPDLGSNSTLRLKLKRDTNCALPALLSTAFTGSVFLCLYLDSVFSCIPGICCD